VDAKTAARPSPKYPLGGLVAEGKTKKIHQVAGSADLVTLVAKDDITAINQLTLPVDKPVLVRLLSKDVIHSFGLYEMRVKQDAVPGLDIPVWFVPNVTTDDMRKKLGKPDFDYEITCSQLCGLGHFRMRGFVNIKTQAEFDSWMEEESKALRAP